MCGYICSLCCAEYDLFNDYITCPNCKGSLLIKYDEYPKSTSSLTDPMERGQWIFKSVLPSIPDEYIVSLGEGGTYLHNAENLIDVYKYDGKILLKDETTNPTGSFVDRGVSLAISYAKYRGYKGVVSVSTGNLGASVSAYSSKAGLNSLIYLPSNIDMGKLYQTLIFGGKVEIINTLDDGYRRINDIVNRGYYPIISNTPLYLEGLKTIGYEIVKDLGWKSPDILIVPMGHGGCISMIWKAFNEMKIMGIIRKIPVFIGVQVKGVTPIVNKFMGIEEAVEGGEIISDISVENPLNINLALMALKESSGTALKVNYNDVVKGVELLAKKEGIYVETAAASTIAALSIVTSEYRGKMIVCILTGMGLKDPLITRELTKNIRAELGIYEEIETRSVGKTKLIILEAINKGNIYGYAIWKYLLDRGIKIKLPTVYQHLSELDRMGLIHVVGKKGIIKPKTVYELTKKGMKMLDLIRII